MGGTKSAGSILRVLNFFNSKIAKPELIIKTPPIMDISVISSAVKKGANQPANI